MTCNYNILYAILIVIIIIFTIKYFDDKYSKNEMFEQEVFSDNVVTYKNTEKFDKSQNVIVESGIDKCVKNCNGNCLELGYTGLSFCFPNKTYKQKYMCDDNCLNTDHLSYPNIVRT